ncbi:hypothetical protein [Rhizobium lusitanum]|uniref:Uncharacterized protein n=1 Tax=Rhizobium lusitanum TaxID=293958 RepID=A0A7X0IW92_9HYPH|nr:hypothetical protein [Rhizobium lusitanum]MBB6487797.1 hypothetical protein [Rhizobium lusitanum]
MKTLRIRLILDFASLALVVLCLAYWWLGNPSHERFGTALFALAIVHNVFNRRWSQTSRETSATAQGC